MTAARLTPDEWLRACYWSPLSGMRDVAVALIAEWGHDPSDHPQLVAEMEVELSGALIETAADLMRARGLRDCRVDSCASAP
ncbi:hypothetical protein SUDANB145_07159 (plasmid) [Streptomyces sp. enrichment culture]|uniref:hypothetical protein n=1 Tax=Streptomyces sp. enrichment culture TaxID=1795815 RepID=UPI003F54F0D0